MIREIYLEKKFPVAPIYWVYGTTGLQIGFEILDFDLASVSSVKFYSQTQSGIRYEATGTKNGSVVLFKPVAGFFAVGHNTLQCELVASPGTVYSFVVPVCCEENNKFEGAEQDPLLLKNYIEQINKNVADINALQKALIGTNVGVLGNVNTQKEYMPKVFLSGGALPTTKTSTTLKFEYFERTEKKFVGYVDIKCQGNSSMDYPKKNFTIKLFEDKNKKVKTKHDFGFGSEQQKYVLKANWIDHSHARNIVTSRIWADCVKSRESYDALPKKLRVDAPLESGIDGFPVKLYHNGVYQGIYTMNSPKDGWMFGMTSKDGDEVILCGEGNNDGDMTKKYATQFRALTTFAPDTDGQWGLEYPDSIPQTTKDSFNSFIAFVMNSSDAEFVNNLGKYVSIESLIDYYLFSYLCTNLDGLGQNMLFISFDGQYWYASAYDLDSTWGLWWNGTRYVSAQYRCPEDYQENNSLLWQRLVTNFGGNLKERYSILREGPLSVGNLIRRFEEFMDVIPNELYEKDGTIFTGIPSTSTNNIKQITEYILARSTYVDGKINAFTGEVHPLKPPHVNAELTKIVATYNGASVRQDTPVSELREYVVIAHYSDGSTVDVTQYSALSGTIQPGNNAIKVYFGDKEAVMIVVGYAIEPLPNLKWLSGKVYNRYTGVLEDNANENCTERFTVSKNICINVDEITGSYVGLFRWSKDGEYLERIEAVPVGAIFNLTPEYEYAFKVYQGTLSISRAREGTKSVTVSLSNLDASVITKSVNGFEFPLTINGTVTGANKFMAITTGTAVISDGIPKYHFIQLAKYYNVLVIATNSNVATVSDFVAYAKTIGDLVIYYE